MIIHTAIYQTVSDCLTLRIGRIKLPNNGTHRLILGNRQSRSVGGGAVVLRSVGGELEDHHHHLLAILPPPDPTAPHVEFHPDL